MKLKIGSVLVTDKDVEQTITKTEEKVTIPKGTKVVVGFDRLAHFLGVGLIQAVDKDVIEEGVDGLGIIESIVACLKDNLSFDDVLKNADIPEEKFRYVMYLALKEIGLFEEEVNEDRDSETSNRK